MSFVHGKNTRVYVGAVDLSPYLNNLDLSVDADVADATVFASAFKTAIAGTGSSTVSVTGLYDPDEASLPTLFDTFAPGVLTYAPAGTAIGDPARLVSVIDTAYGESSPVGGVVALSASFQGDGVVGFGYLLHPLGEDANSTSGATRDDGAATATGWTAHLHVAAVTGGSWVVKIQDASASNLSDIADVAFFTAATGATSQRMQSAASTTALRRYVRYVATRTGGSVGEGITFALALARNR